MDEIDNIIIHSLRQIGCSIDEDITSLSGFTPEKLVETVIKCLQLIKPDMNLPKALPPGMAQRYSVTTATAEACVAVGFRGDIGYQTFLYSNVIEVRRVFMFLIERLPKETEKIQQLPTDDVSALEQEIAHNIRMQLNAAWTPQYCKKHGVVKYGTVVAVQSSNTPFSPQKLNIPHVTQSDTSISPELRDYWLKRSPTLFQQTNSNNLCASIIQKNDVDRRNVACPNFGKLMKLMEKQQRVKAATATGSTSSASSGTRISKDHIRNIKSVQQLTLNNIEIPNQNDIVSMPEISPVDALNFDVEKLKQSIEQCVINRKTLMTKISDIKELKATEELVIAKLRDDKRIKERTHILLENPEVNVAKMGAVLAATTARMQQLSNQWQEHRIPLVQQLERAGQSTAEQSSHTRHIIDQLKSVKDKSLEITEDLQNKIVIHAQIVGELEKFNKTISRNDYTSRILEIVGNIRKQKADIDKVLIDTRELQKEINLITGQLDRQFTVTDDLLFKTAKRDEHTKNAYKLLATLHADCSDLVSLVQETGAVMREIRDLEEQIETEKARNVAETLHRITADLKLAEDEGKDILQKIANRKVEATGRK